MRRTRATLLCCAAGAVASASACGKRDVAPASGSGSTTAAASPTTTGEWPAALGPMLVVPSDTDDQAVVLYPVGSDAAPLRAARLALLGPGGDTLRAQVGLNADDSLHCGDAPLVRLTRSVPASWSVGLELRQVTALRSDSLDQLAADSAFIATEMARLASAVRAGETSRFTGLPFALASIRRVRVAGREVVAAQLVRRVNQEADPAEEHTLVIAERDATRPRSAFSATHTDRAEGFEDTADHFDLVATIRTKGATLFIISRDRATGTTFEILERSAAGDWRVRWTRVVGC